MSAADMPGVRRVTSWDDLPGVIVAAEQAGAIGIAVLTRGLREGRNAFWPIMRDSSAAEWKKFSAKTRGRPAIALIGDDDYRDLGPASWRLANRIIRWAAAVMVHAAGAERSHYEAAIAAAQIAGRVLVVECSPATSEAWLALARTAPNRPRVLLIHPTDGAHPILPARGEMQ